MQRQCSNKCNYHIHYLHNNSCSYSLTMLFLLLSFLSPLLVSSAPYVGEERIMMIQAQSCEFSPYYKTLSCTCLLYTSDAADE